MSLYRITVKMHSRSANMIIEPGMSVEVFGVDLKKMGCLNSGFLKVDKVG